MTASNLNSENRFYATQVWGKWSHGGGGRERVKLATCVNEPRWLPPISVQVLCNHKFSAFALMQTNSLFITICHFNGKFFPPIGDATMETNQQYGFVGDRTAQDPFPIALPETVWGWESLLSTKIRRHTKTLTILGPCFPLQVKTQIQWQLVKRRRTKRTTKKRQFLKNQSGISFPPNMHPGTIGPQHVLDATQAA